MTDIQELGNGIYWLGALDTNLAVFDIIMETKYGTTYNAYLIKTEEGAVLVETVKEPFFDSYLDHIKNVIGDLANIKYLISNHTEPDHSGSIKKLLDVIPGLTVVASKTAISYLQEIVNHDFNYRTAEQLKELKVGSKTFQFISCPFLHWPDSMYSYLKEDHFLFTCDSFGSHYSPKYGSVLMSKLPKEEEEHYQDALLYYYTAIFGPFKDYVLKGIDKIKDLEIKCICTGHGPVLDARCWEIVETYKKWSTPAPSDKKHKTVIIPYVSAYGYTGEIADDIEKGIKEVDATIEVKKYNIHIQNYGDLKPKLVAEIAAADGVVLGTNTINGDAIPFIWDLALSMNPITHGGKIVSAFGSYGWSGEGVDNIMDRLKQIRCKVVEGFKIKFRQSQKEHEDAVKFGRIIGQGVVTGEVPMVKPKVVGAANWEELNPSGKVVLWRCVVCGEIYAGVEPPLVCPACGVGQECFELYEEETITFSTDKAETFVIIGSGAAAVSAAEAIRARSHKAVIKMISKEDKLPYYRTAISDLIVKDLPFEEFFVHEDSWYTEQRIEVQLNTAVSRIDTGAKKVYLFQGGEVSYDKLILATGAAPNKPPIVGSEAEGVVLVRTDADALKVRELAKKSKHAVVIGGGVLGLEMVDSIMQLGCSVDVIEFMPRLMPRQLDEDSSKYLQDYLLKRGVKLHLSTATKQILSKDGKVVGVDIGCEAIDCDFVVINIGVHANAEIAKEAGIEIGRNIVVNEKMETSVPGVYACGDCAEFGKMCQALWLPAINQGKVAGANAVGDEKTFSWAIEPVSMLAFDTDLIAVGNVPAPETLDEYSIVKEANTKNGRFLKLYFKDDKLAYAVGFGFTTKANALIKGVRQGHSLPVVMSAIYA